MPGHEIIGHVTAVGRNVDRIREGTRVGIGWQCGACLSCELCINSDDNLCENQQATCVEHFGGFADSIRVDSRFAFPIPTELPSEDAAPLLCGGITVYSALRHYRVRPSMKVGIIGIGGLGHLALQYASAFGSEVTAFSSSLTKEEAAKDFGAHHFITSTDITQLQKAANSLDFILSTVSADLNWADYLNVLRPNGILCIVGVPKSSIQIPASPLIGVQKMVCGSSIGSRSMIMEMLKFSARHGIMAKTETLPMDKVNEALNRVAKNKARYRMVLAN